MKRRHCAKCGKPMPIRYDVDYSDRTILGGVRLNRWRYMGYGHFCTMRCATDYANAVKGGYPENPWQTEKPI